MLADIEAREQYLQSEFKRLDELRRRMDVERLELNDQKARLQDMARRIKEDAALLAAKSKAIQGMQMQHGRVWKG